jgi:indolepyruvate ferredoxin oxidoreductase alpha subunit
MLSHLPTEEVRELLRHCVRILVLEELEPYLEQKVYTEAQRTGFKGEIFGKIDGLFSRIGEYELKHVLMGLKKAANLEIPDDIINGNGSRMSLYGKRE